ncbi:threonine ammonia-lyase [Salinisphaera orenii]|uniref:L-threonine ammonia-lyase n=1 Tax=Salinisphaera orenii YIM 95161 TaxID=1051139 RepID=A0A423PLD6_9GAMM|nr:pyridoxal-phosphate dependent enzyme [Salinisphaera halophila]ROO26398.1 L-threonine ammonia-lyase [Salinisphaera halophila YIM 95161]
MQPADTAPRAADIDAARAVVAERLAPTPLVRADDLGADLAGDLYLKCELLQPTGSFKPRGALNWLANASDAERAAGLVTVSAGNHATALAWAAASRGLPVTVVMPADASPLKAESARALGATVELIGGIDDAWARARELEASGLTLVPPYDDPRIIAGAGTMGLEILDQCPRVPDVVVCCVGGGGLISGVGLALKQAHPDIRVVGVEPAGAPTLARSWAAGEPVTLASTDTIAASLGANRAGRWTHAVSRQVVDELVAIDEPQIVAGTRATLTRGRLHAEPGGAIAVAALLAGRVPLAAGQTAVAIVSGGNMDPSLLRDLL